MKLIGYRAWRINDDDNLIPLTMASGGAWSRGVNVAACKVAEYRPDGHKCAAKADFGCTCGFWAFIELRDAVSLAKLWASIGGAGIVVGAIAASGTITTGAQWQTGTGSARWWSGPKRPAAFLDSEYVVKGFRASRAEIVALAHDAVWVGPKRVDDHYTTFANFRDAELVPIPSRARAAADNHGIPSTTLANLPAVAGEHGHEYATWRGEQKDVISAPPQVDPCPLGFINCPCLKLGPLAHGDVRHV